MTAPTSLKLPAGVVVKGALAERYDEVLSHDALAFVADLQRRFNETRKRLLAMRKERQKRFDAGETPDFLAETKHIREGDWEGGADPGRSARPPRRDHRPGRPQDDRQRAQLRRQGVHGRFRGRLLAGLGQYGRGPDQPPKDRWTDKIDFTDPTSGKAYKLKDKPAVLIIRPRGWHLPERHIEVDGEIASGALVDFGLYLFHNAKAALAQGSGPYFYLPKLESHLEARLWNDVFVAAQAALGPEDRGRSRRPCWSRPCRRPSRWTRSSTSCASTWPASIAAAGTTSSPSSRSSPATRPSSCPTARRS
jgi:malate synthase